jgi:hypothetical protein
MKRKISILAIILFLFCSTVFASSINGDYKGNPVVKVLNNGVEVTADDTPAMILENRTMVPIYLLKKLGVSVDWNQDNYSVNVAFSNGQNTDYKKQIMASDFFVYMQNATRYIDAFGGLMDQFYSTENAKGFSSKDYDTLTTYMNDTYNKLTELINKYNAIYLKINAADANEAFKNIDDIKTIVSILQDAFIDMTAWKMAKYENNNSPDIYNQSYNSYLTKAQNSHSKALAVMDILSNDYTKSVSDSLK